jgi:hypothetical protein
MNKFGTIKAKTSRIASQSTIHGLVNIVNADYFGMKLFWLVSFTLALAYSSYLTIDLIIKYLDYNVIIDIKFITDYNLEFPAVAFCNLNGLNNSSSFLINEMLLTCTFNSRPCDSNLFTQVSSATYGDCLAINAATNRSSVPLRSLRAGRDLGLSMQLYAGAPSRQTTWASSTGIVVALFNRSSSRPLFTEEGIKISSGVETNLYLTRQEFRALPQPFSNCIEDVLSKDAYDSAEYRSTFDVSSAYRQKICVQRCSAAYANFSNYAYLGKL